MKFSILSAVKFAWNFVVVTVLVIGSLAICRADGIAWVLNSSSYSVADGGTVNGSVDLVENTSDIDDQSWPDHNQTDEALANEAAGLSDTPQGYTWHHVENGTTMQLVPQDIHQAVRHTGGAAIITGGN